MASAAPGVAVSRMRRQRHKIFRAVFPTDVARPAAPAPAGALASLPPAPLPRAHRSAAAAVTRSTAAAAAAPAAASSSSSSSLSSSQPPAPVVSADQARWDRAWHTVTSRIQLPSSVAAEDSFGTLAPASQDHDFDGGLFYQSLAVLLGPEAALPHAAHTGDILSWHGLQVRHHFVHHVLPLLAACAGQGGDSQVLLGIVDTLEAAHRQYLYGLRLIARGFGDDASAGAAVAKFERDLHALVSNSWTPGLTQALRGVLRHSLRIILASAHPSTGGLGPGWDKGMDVERSRAALFRLVDSLQMVGLAGEKLQVLFAEVMDACMQDFIKETYSGVWARPPKTRGGTPRSGAAGAAGAARGPPCMHHLGRWIENCYGRLAVEVLSRFGGRVAWSDVERWRDIAIGRLATLRMHELFDIVLGWPRSAGGLDDLAFAVTTPQRRLQLTDIFSATLQKRLLHPGRSTLDILQTYISMIRTFHALDHSKVLLDRVVPALKLCLWMRDDAIRIVVTGLLANAADADNNNNNNNNNKKKKQLVELATILDEASQQQRRPADYDEDLDWTDMAWVPDPVDAGANYKRPRNEDIIGTLIGALGLQDVFITEFQAIVAERLLSSQPAFEQEIKVLGLLKKRFGDAALQNCDVMTKDILDSQRLDALLQRSILLLRPELAAGGDNSPPPTPAFHAKILSRLFWPTLPREPFALPAPVAAVQRRYEAAFERAKAVRKLKWLDQLGSATVRLDLADRTLELECKTYEAAVIYAFRDDDPAPRRFEDLWRALAMDEELLEGALRFWTAKRVLRLDRDGAYVVVERLLPEHHDGDAAAQAPSPRRARADGGREAERRAVYWQFIVGMLTNSGPAMPLAQIGMMMRMLIADGCAWGDEELQAFLADQVARGELEFSGGKYRLPKK